jgi:hypothetical protein
MIPRWNSIGILPPFDENNPTSSSRSPYMSSLDELALHFCESPQRQKIFRGFLEYRNWLQDIGIKSGFQWIDGSFLEHVEMIESREPQDLDVVTFYKLPPGKTQEDLSSTSKDLFSPNFTKTKYQVDAYYVQLDSESPEYLVKQTSYWYSLWSHRRNRIWKGFIQINLDEKYNNHNNETKSKET